MLNRILNTLLLTIAVRGYSFHVKRLTFKTILIQWITLAVEVQFVQFIILLWCCEKTKDATHYSCYIKVTFLVPATVKLRNYIVQIMSPNFKMGSFVVRTVGVSSSSWVIWQMPRQGVFKTCLFLIVSVYYGGC